ncbi:MAG: hypothetical protein GW763_00535 [Paraglaciecola sp.]|nr:hypothetical protein [Paraglaciecola sp.]NCT46479.1 hypothetical protein [Paraglaciecola sp.]
MNEYMLLYKGGDPDWMANTSAEQMAASMQKWGEWMADLKQQGRLSSGGAPLDYSGKRLSADGLVTEILARKFKELVTGYSIIRASTMDEALNMAKDCPIFQYPNIVVEVRQVMEVG